MKNAIIAQSGGPTAAINASLAGVLRANKNEKVFDTIFGSLHGITGILEGEIMNLSACAAEEGFIDTLKLTPAMYLGSCRFRMPNPTDSPETYEKIFSFFQENDIDAFFYIGGNDSMDTVDKMSAYAKQIQSSVRIIGIPKTIDNDLLHIDHTPGFGSAAKYVATCILEMALDTSIYPIKSVTIAEIMGRDAGWLTAASALARNEYNSAPHLIYLPEHPFDTISCLEDIKKLLETQNNVLIAISEGIHDRDGNYICAAESHTDRFGHQQLSGAGKTLELLIGKALGVKTRSVEINILQRCAAHLASETDLNESMQLGETAVHCAAEGQTGVMACLERIPGEQYILRYSSYPVNQIANGVKSVPLSWINDAGNDVTDEMLDYLRPLIQGEPKISYKDGLPEYLPISHLVH